MQTLVRARFHYITAHDPLHAAFESKTVRDIARLGRQKNVSRLFDLYRPPWNPNISRDLPCCTMRLDVRHKLQILVSRRGIHAIPVRDVPGCKCVHWYLRGAGCYRMVCSTFRRTHTYLYLIYTSKYVCIHTYDVAKPRHKYRYFQEGGLVHHLQTLYYVGTYEYLVVFRTKIWCVKR